MSKKGQDNQRGINFQNEVALLYMLDHYRYANFTEIRFEGNNLEDFTLFFTKLNNNSTFFYNFEVKNWKTPLSLARVREIIKKEAEKGIDRYSDKGQFFIVAPLFKEDCKEIESFKKNYFFNSKKDFEKTKTLYKERYGKSPLFSWSKEEILFLKYVHLVEIKSENINAMIIDRFCYEDPFFYTKDNLENIISRFLDRIIDESSSGKSLSKGKIQDILAKFHKAETDKSESYNLEQDLGHVIDNIETKLETENEFEKLNHSRYITPISSRPKAIFYITDKLKQKQFKLKSIQWFLENILIKHCYFFECLDLLKIYIENDLTEEDKVFILEFMFKIHEKSSSGSSLQKSEFNSYSNERILDFLRKISACQKVSEPLKNKFIKFLENSIPDWRNKEPNNYSRDSYNYQHIPKLIENLLNHSEKGLEIIFKKHDFTNEKERAPKYDSPYYKYIEKFIDKDFKTNFPLVIKNLSNQFQSLYESYGYRTDFYKGYEISGGGYSGFGNNYNLHVLPLESILSQCICKYYDNTQDWEFLNSFLDSKIDKTKPVFVKRSFIPFLLKKLKKASEKNQEDNKFYKALVSILKIKQGFPSTEDILTNELGRIHSGIKDHHLEKLVEIILYKYSKEGISYDIFTIQLLFQLIENGRLNFKTYLKKILLNKTLKTHYVYDQALGLFASRMENKNINEFFKEIKNELDISQNQGLKYRSIILDLETPSLEKSELSRIFKSSSEKDLNDLALIIEKDLWNTSDSNLLEKVLEFMKNHLDLEDFYKRIKISEHLKRVIIQLIERAINYDISLSEKIINLCIKDTHLCGENEKLHNEVAKGDRHPSISTMRSHLCYAINNYIIRYQKETDKKSLEKLEKAFSWVKLLIDLDGSPAGKIEGFPRPNYYLRSFAIIPLINLAHHEIRNKLNDFKKGSGDKVKEFAFAIIEKTKEEVEKNKYKPLELFHKISHLFDYIRDLNEEEAKRFLSFVGHFRIAEANYFFIYYALFREKQFNEKGEFKSECFKKMLKDICKSNPDELKRKLSFTIYKGIENENKETRKTEPDFNFFEKIKDYWILLFENSNKDMFFHLLMTLSFVLKNKRYYKDYKKYFFQLIEKELKNRENSSDYFIHLDQILPAISENNPDDLAETLFLFLSKGDPIKGYIPFSYEVKQKLIPEIKKVRNKISPEKLCEVKKELQKYNETLG